MPLPQGVLPPELYGQTTPPVLSDAEAQEQKVIKFMKAAQESCVGKSMVAGVMGFGLGGMFGIFMSGMRYDTPLHSPLNPAPLAVAGNAPNTTVPLSDLPLRQQLRHAFTDTRRAAFSSAKNFGTIGLMYSGTECCIEGLRGRNDLYNSVATGFVVGGLLARKSGLKAMGLGGAGFAVFSAGIDWYMRMPANEERLPVI